MQPQKTITTAQATTPQTIASALQLLMRADVRLSREQVGRLAHTVAPLSRAGLLTPAEQTALAAILARHNRMIG